MHSTAKTPIQAGASIISIINTHELAFYLLCLRNACGTDRWSVPHAIELNDVIEKLIVHNNDIDSTACCFGCKRAGWSPTLARNVILIYTFGNKVITN